MMKLNKVEQEELRGRIFSNNGKIVKVQEEDLYIFVHYVAEQTKDELFQIAELLEVKVNEDHTITPHTSHL